MKRFQSLDESLFQDSKLSAKQLEKVYGGDLKPTGGTTSDCSSKWSVDKKTWNCDVKSDTFKDPH